MELRLDELMSQVGGASANSLLAQIELISEVDIDIESQTLITPPATEVPLSVSVSTDTTIDVSGASDILVPLLDSWKTLKVEKSKNGM